MDANFQFLAAKSTRKARARISTLLTLVLLSACGQNSDDTAEPPAVAKPEPAAINHNTLASFKLNALKNCDAYKTYVTDALVEQFRPRGWSLEPVMNTTTESQPVPAAPGGASSALTHVTGTNIQEAGVDEPDIVKTDAKGNLYIARGSALRVVAGHPAEKLKELAALDAGGNIYDLFLDEPAKRAVLFAAHYEQMIPVSPPNAGGQMSPLAFYQRVKYIVSFVDVANPAQPVLTARWTLDGVPLDARRISARVHFVLSTPLDLPVSLTSDAAFWTLYSDYYSAPNADAAAAVEQKIVGAIRAVLEPMDATKLLPVVSIEKNGQTVTQPMVGCGDVSSPKTLVHPALLTVASFDTDGGNLSASAITAYGATVYASSTNLYVTQYSGGWFTNEQAKPQTAIHQFSVSGTAPKYVATGAVDGWVQSAFNLSEYDGNLRVATNTNVWSQGVTTRTNDLFILSNNGSGELVTRGSVRNFGEGEMMFSSRFLGTRGFAVTFRRVDPLFAFDLSNPDHPRLVGELTIPGFSTYLHPLGDKHLLTIGRDAATSATQLQIFDVSDLSHPKLAHALTPALPTGGGYSYSAAEYDHHAFTFDETSNVLAIPLSYSSSSTYFNGIAAFKIDTTTGIKEIVQVDHADLANQGNCSVELPLIVPCNYWYAANPSRSVIMTADTRVTLYSISDAGVKATALAPPNALLGAVVFPPEPVSPIVVIAQ